MAAAAAILAGVLLPCWGAFPQLNKGLLKLILTLTLGGGLLVLSPFDGCGNGSKDTHYLATGHKVISCRADRPQACLCHLCSCSCSPRSMSPPSSLLLGDSQLSYPFPADQGSHQHHVPLPHGLDLRLQGPGLSPPVPFALEEDAGCHCPPPSLPWGQRPWASESCSKFSS
nr:colipase-like protein 2 isoform X2 [Equus asinus]